MDPEEGEEASSKSTSTIIQVDEEVGEEGQGVAAAQVAIGDNGLLVPSPLFTRGLYPDLQQQLQVSGTV